MTPAEVERKVRQLDNDVQSIYELLMGIQSTQTRHTNRLHELGEDLGSLDAKVDSLDTKVDSLDTKVDSLGTQMDEVLQLLRAR
jgi:peptidoglycan hydrolase CwlO-like protein